MKRITRTLRAVASLARLGMAPLTVSVPVLGALSTGSRISPATFAGMAGLGLCAHIFGFALNDIIDQPVDVQSPYRQRCPLQSGGIDSTLALPIAFAPVVAAYAAYGALTHWDRTGIVILSASVVLSIAYNRWSKRGIVPRLIAEGSLALSLGLLDLAGGLAANSRLPPQTYVHCVTLMPLLLLLNSLPGGLKDLQTDTASGVWTFAMSLGCRAKADGRLHIPRLATLYATLLQGAVMAGLLALVVLLRLGWLHALLVIVLPIFAWFHLRMLLRVRTSQAVRDSMPLLSGYYNYAAWSWAMVILMPTWLRLLYTALVVALLVVPIRLSFKLWRFRETHRYMQKFKL